MTSSLKQALNKTILNISERFDYRIMIAPIIRPENRIAYVAENPVGISSGISLISKEDAVTNLGNLPIEGGSYEPGFDSSLYVLNQGMNSGFLRRNGHTVVVLMSNGDDYDYLNSENCMPGALCPANISYVEQKASAIKNYLASTMASESYHFYTLVPHKSASQCSGVGGKYASVHYKYASQLISGIADSIDICSTAFTHVFDKVNNSIEETVLKHKYNYWPIIETTVKAAQEPFDRTKITVTKMISGNPMELTEGTDWEYLGFASNLNIRYAPTTGEKTSGYFIYLKNSGVVTYPECLRIETQEPATCYGYVHLQNKPLESSIVLKINGQTIPQSSNNGWKYIGYKASQNIRTQCAGSTYQPGSELKTGHFLQLFGNAIYGNNSTVELTYDPTGL